jgi:DNA (cytosine-5)-methyltransferase 1
MTAYYNEHDAYPAQWLRNLISAGHIASGDVDERSIEDVRPDELSGYRQCHFFAGVGGWSLALRLAGIPDDRPVWTGSCPCQPYSVASVAVGGAEGQSDSRHLWPAFRSLIRQRKPSIVFGEQVGSAIQWGWWDEVALDLESDGYAAAASILRADSVGADHERQRLYWVANAGGTGWQGYQPDHSVSVAAKAAFAELGDPFAGARRSVAGDYSHLLPRDGVSVALERLRAHGYGNAIVPQVAAAFIEAVMECAP